MTRQLWIARFARVLRHMVDVADDLGREHIVLYGTWPGNDCPWRPECGLHKEPFSDPPEAGWIKEILA